MSKNAESLNNSLFELLRSRGYEPTLLGTDGKEIPVPDEAEVFQFHFKKDDEDYGPVTISIDGLNKLIIYYGDSVAQSPSGDSESGDISWYTLLKHLKRFAHQHQLSFELKNTDHLKYDMAKRTHMKKMDESSLFVKKLTTNEQVMSYIKYAVVPEMRKYGVPRSLTTHYTTISSAVFEGVSKVVDSGKDLLDVFERMDQFNRMNIKVGAMVSILMIRMAQSQAELFGFKTPKKITKIYREPSDNSIRQFEFNNDPDDVWPRQPLASYNGQTIMSSAFFPNAQSVDHAITALRLACGEDIKMHINITESKNMKKVDEAAKWRSHPDAQDDTSMELYPNLTPKGDKKTDLLQRPMGWAEKGKLTPDSVKGQKQRLKYNIGKHGKSSVPEQVAEGYYAGGRRYTGDSKVPTGTMVEGQMDETMYDGWRSIKSKAGNTVHVKSEPAPGNAKLRVHSVHLDKKSPPIEKGKHDKQKLMKRAQDGEFDTFFKKKVEEGYYATGRKSSYSDNVPQVKIILQHSRQLEEGERRYRAIERIFVENAAGERFLLDTKKPGLARVYARHIAEGGTPYDEQGKHIHSLVEEYTKMAGFVRATRNGQFNESTQSLVNEGINHYNNLREQLHKMSGHRGYTAYFESWAPTLTEDEDTTDLSEMFASNELDPRIESVMPILRKLNKTISEMSEVTELDEWANQIIDEGDGLEAIKPVGIPEGIEPDKKQRLDALIVQYRNATDPESQDYNTDFGMDNLLNTDDDPEEIIAQIRAEFGDRTADSVEHGPSMHYPRDNHTHGHDTLAGKKSPRVTQAGKVNKQDAGYMKRSIQGNLGNNKLAGVLPEEVEHDMAEGSLTYGNKCAGPFASEDRARREASRISKELGVRRYVEKTADGKYIVVKKQGVAEDISPEQKRVGQLGPKDKVGKKGAVGKLVGGTCESVDQGVAEGSSLGYTVIVRGNDFSYSRLKDALSDGHPSPAKVYKNGKFLGTIGSLSNQGVAEGSENILPKGTSVTVLHKGKQVPGKIVRYDTGKGGYSSAYVVDIGKYESIFVPASKIQQGVAEDDVIPFPGKHREQNDRLYGYPAGSENSRKFRQYRKEAEYYTTGNGEVHIPAAKYYIQQRVRGMDKGQAEVLTAKNFGDEINSMSEGTGGRSEWDPNSSGYQGDYGGEDNWGNHERDDERHDLDQVTFQLSMDGDVLPKTYSSKELARFAGQALLKQNPGAVVMLKTVSGLAEAKTWTNNMGDKQTYYDHDKPKKPDFAAKFKKNLDKTKKQADDTEDKIKQHDEKPVKEGVDPLDALKRLLGK